MAKLKAPFLGFKARGSLAKLLSYRRRGSQTIVESKPIPPDAKSTAQLSWRHMYQKATALWNALSAAEKQEWETNARPKHMTGYAWFMSQCLKPNPGIYLPLQGGIMSGDIDMNSHDILRLGEVSAHKSGDIDLGANELIWTNSRLQERWPGELAIRNAADTEYKNLVVSIHYLFDSIKYMATPGTFCAHNYNGARVILEARHTGAGLAEIARLQGATVAHLLLTRAKFTTTPHAADVGHRGMFYYTEGAAGVADKLYCIMKGTDNNYSAVQVAIG